MFPHQGRAFSSCKEAGTNPILSFPPRFCFFSPFGPATRLTPRIRPAPLFESQERREERSHCATSLESGRSLFLRWGRSPGKGRRKAAQESLVYGHWHAPLPSKPLLFSLSMASCSTKTKTKTKTQTQTHIPPSLPPSHCNHLTSMTRPLLLLLFYCCLLSFPIHGTFFSLS